MCACQNAAIAMLSNGVLIATGMTAAKPAPAVAPAIVLNTVFRIGKAPAGACTEKRLHNFRNGNFMHRKTSVNLRQFVTRQKVTLFVTALFMACFLVGFSLGMDVAFSLVP